MCVCLFCVFIRSVVTTTNKHFSNHSSTQQHAALCKQIYCEILLMRSVFNSHIFCAKGTQCAHYHHHHHHHHQHCILQFTQIHNSLLYSAQNAPNPNVRQLRISMRNSQILIYSYCRKTQSVRVCVWQCLRKMQMCALAHRAHVCSSAAVLLI